jgi:hypothetical protein
LHASREGILAFQDSEVGPHRVSITATAPAP